MQQNDVMTKDQLLTPTEAARAKGMSLNQLKHHLKNPGAPAPILVGLHRHKFYDVEQIQNWQPKVRKK